MSKLTTKKIFERLIALAKRGHQTGANVTTISREQAWISADMVHQEALCKVQDDMIGLLLDLAQSMDDAAVKHLVAAFPWAFKVTTTETAS